MNYPTTPCDDHPSRKWEWDGYCFVCPGCVLNYGPESKAVQDECGECSATVWYDPNDPSGVTCEDEDLAVEHECDLDYEEDEDDT